MESCGRANCVGMVSRSSRAFVFARASRTLVRAPAMAELIGRGCQVIGRPRIPVPQHRNHAQIPQSFATNATTTLTNNVYQSALGNLHYFEPWPAPKKLPNAPLPALLHVRFKGVDIAFTESSASTATATAAAAAAAAAAATSAE